ncbi:MAG: DUF1707 SHOCT-like domain-containing protein [Candidatus Dormibacteria bacterium]
MYPASRPLGPPSTRASDSDRETVVEELRQHHADGRLSLDELEERVGRAFQARTMGELTPVLADLPQPPPPPPPPPTVWQRLQPRAGYLVPAVVGVGVVGGVVAGTLGTGAHAHDGFSFGVPFLFLGLFWLRRGRHPWGRHQRSCAGGGSRPRDAG